MSTPLDSQLLPESSTLHLHNVNQWQVRQVIVLDWYDGPREGLCELAQPASCFYFELFAERYSEDELDDRLFVIYEVPANAVNQIFSKLSTLDQPKSPLWIPRWQFKTETERLETESQIDSLLAQSKRTNLIIQTKDMLNIQDCWQQI